MQIMKNHINAKKNEEQNTNLRQGGMNDPAAPLIAAPHWLLRCQLAGYQTNKTWGCNIHMPCRGRSRSRGPAVRCVWTCWPMPAPAGPGGQWAVAIDWNARGCLPCVPPCPEVIPRQ